MKNLIQPQQPQLCKEVMSTMHKLDDTLKHYGILGMKWGVRRNRNQPGGADGIDNSTEEKVTRRGRIAQQLDSLKRERQWRKVLKDMDKLSTTDISAAAKRIGLENDLKSLSRSKVGSKKDKQDYLRRADMSNEELSRKVIRLRAKDNLYKKVSSADQEQREFGSKVARIGALVSVKYALTKSFDPKDVFDGYKNSKESSKQAKKLILDKVPDGMQKELLKDLLDKIDTPDKSKS